ncbi:MAG: DUF3604 domain-containing protein [Planctomycetes bacterium]|nr:DUF3604 domain-containing protein [Planctomycetota bacterium]
MFFRKRSRCPDFEIGAQTAPDCGSAALAFEYVSGERVEGTHVSAVTGRLGTWEIIYTAGERGIAEGGSIAIARATWSGFRFDYRPQSRNPKGIAFMSIEADTEAELQLIPNTTNPSHRRPVALVLARMGAMKKGDTFVLRIGDRRSGGPGAVVPSTVWKEAKILIGVDPEGAGEYRQLPCSPLIVNTVPGDAPKRYHLFAPSIVRPDEPFHLHVLAIDENGNICTKCDHMLRVHGPPTLGHMPMTFGFAKQDAGCRRFSDAVIDAEGRVRIELEDAKLGITARSNPVLCTASPRKRIFWGDLHAHAYDAQEIRDLTPTTHPAESYRFARDVARLDFCAVASHIFEPELDAVWWPIAQKAAAAFHEPGRFITFLGCEWRGKRGEGGDRNVIFKDEHNPVVNSKAAVNDLYEIYRDTETLIIPHVGGAIADWDHHDPDLEVLAEVASGHGNFEWFAQEALSKGRRVGLIGSSDGHRGTPGLPRAITSGGGGRFAKYLNRRDSGYGGGPLAAVYAEELTRNAIWDAIRRREVYATTGARIFLNVKLNGFPMGSEMETKRPPQVLVDVEGAGDLLRVDLIRNQEVILSAPGNGPSKRLEHIDRWMPKGTSYYYVRVLQRNREVAWSSPIWVRNVMDAKKIPRKHYPSWNTNESVVLKAVPENDADAHLDALMDYLEREEKASRFRSVTPIEVVDSQMGKFALFYAYLLRRSMPISIKWFFEFECPRIRIEPGWLDFGPWRVT